MLGHNKLISSRVVKLASVAVQVRHRRSPLLTHLLLSALPPTSAEQVMAAKYVLQATAALSTWINVTAPYIDCADVLQIWLLW
jgi:hypothetical protein